MNPSLLPYFTLGLGLRLPHIHALYSIPSWVYVLRIIEEKGWLIIEEGTSETTFLYEKDGSFLKMNIIPFDPSTFHINIDNDTNFYFTSALFQWTLNRLIKAL